MKHEILHIKEYFPVLGENDCDATLTTYLPDNLSEINRENEKHPCLFAPAEAMDAVANGRLNRSH